MLVRQVVTLVVVGKCYFVNIKVPVPFCALLRVYFYCYYYLLRRCSPSAVLGAELGVCKATSLEIDWSV